MAISTWRDLLDHVEHQIATMADYTLDRYEAVCATCDETLVSHETHNVLAAKVYVEYRSMVEASALWPDVRKAFPHPDDCGNDECSAPAMHKGRCLDHLGDVGSNVGEWRDALSAQADKEREAAKNA